MIRTFCTHRVRRTEELTSSLWTFAPVTDERAEERSVAVPSCWETYPGYENFRGVGRYTTQFYAEGNVRLVFEGVSHTARVFVDGREAARHYNAYTPFAAVVKGLAAGTHTLTVEADNRFSAESALHVPNDYMSYGGISRPVSLEHVGDAWIERVHVTPACKDGVWHAHVRVFVKSLKNGGAMSASVTIDGQTLAFPPRTVSEGETVFEGDMAFEHAAPWSPETPVLYTAEARLLRDGAAADDLFERFGFREVRVEGKNILLNGKKLLVKGVCRHEDHPQYGCALPYEAMAYDLSLIRDLGANAVRTAHYPDDERFLDLCDELGILVWEENHARGLSLEQMQNPNFEAQAEEVIREMIAAHYNHPSIFVWGILNECASDTAYGRECYQKQFALIRALDPSRPRSFASCKFKTDLCFDLCDIVSYNIYPLWYHDTPPAAYVRDLYEWAQTAGGAGKPFLVTEIGAGGIYGYRAPHAPKWSEEYQAKALKAQLESVLSFEDCAGVYIWQFCDIRISDEWWGGRPRTMNNKGVFDEYRRPKLCHAVVKEIFSRK